MTIRHILTRATLTWLGFIPLFFLFDRAVLFNLLTGAALCASVLVLTGFSTGILAAIKRGTRLDRAHYLVLGIACTWTSVMMYGTIFWVWRNGGKPDWLMDHAITAFAIYMMVCGGLLHLAAYETIGHAKGDLPSRYWFVVGFILSVAVGAAYTVLTIGIMKNWWGF